jgi:halogenation protein CepH
MRGYRVLLLEALRFPRYKIGESLLPSSVHQFARLLGVREKLEKAGFVRKYGGTFRWGVAKDAWEL